MPNGVVKPVLSKAMPVILTMPKKCDAWPAEPHEALKLQRLLPDELSNILSTGPREDSETEPVAG